MADVGMRGAEHIAKALQDHNVRVVFSLSGNQIMPVYDALFASSIRIVHTRHEAAAVYMAEALAQITGDVGVALITAAPGFANALSAFYTARESETPLLVLSGDAPLARDGRGAFQELDQCAAAAPLVKASCRALHAGSLYDDVTRAIALAKSGRPGPVHLALPDDVLRQLAVAGAAASVLPSAQKQPSASVALIEEIQTALDNSSAPLLLAGPVFCRPPWKPTLGTLADRLNVPVVTFESPRGLRAPRLGAFGEVSGAADLVVSFGKPLDFMIGFGERPVLRDDCKIIQIDADAGVLARDANAHTSRDLRQHCISPAAVIEKLIADCSSTLAGAAAWRGDVAAAIAHRPALWQQQLASGPINSLAFAKAIATFAAARPDATLIIDGGEIGQWSQALADAEFAIINGPSGAIGASLPYAVGARLARPDRDVITVMGDGTAGFYLAEFETAVRENIPFVAVIGNDARWNAEYQIQVRDYGEQRAFGCDLTPARYDRVAAELGGYGEYVKEAEHILPALERALVSGKPACVNVMIDGQAAPVISRR